MCEFEFSNRGLAEVKVYLAVDFSRVQLSVKVHANSRNLQHRNNLMRCYW